MTEAEEFWNVDSSHIVTNGVFDTFLSYTTIMLNITTIHALRKTSSLPKPLKTLFLCLALSDLGVGLLVQPLNVASLLMMLKENTENNPTYKITNSVLDVTSTFLCYASLFGVTALTADRFLAIHLYLRYQELVTHKRLVAVATSICMLSAILSSLWLWNPKIYSIVTATTFFNCKIHLAARQHTHQIQVLLVQQVGPSNNVIRRYRRQRKFAIGTFYVYLVFLVCYFPHISINVVHAITGESTFIETLWSYTMTLVYLNILTLNPLVYCLKIRYIRHAVINILRNLFLSETTT